MRDIRAGALRTPIFLGRPVVTKDDAGGEVLAWEERATMALIELPTGREWVTGTAIKDQVDARITVRLIPGWIPTARWRVRVDADDRIYTLVAAMPIPQNGAVECLGKSAIGNSDGR
jgi:head-tail adaptor